MRITHLRVNHLENPLGYDLGIPSFSWQVKDTISKKQEAAQLWIAADQKFQQICYDSGKGPLNSLGERAAFRMTPCARYYWKVQVWGDQGDTAVSDTAWFELGRCKEGIVGCKWITADFGNQHPLFRKRFRVEKPLQKARLYLCGLGLYEAYLNGEKIGREYFTPYCNDYDSWQQMQTYDVTPYLQQGDNAIGVMLGKGWYMGRMGFDFWDEPLYGERFLLIGLMELTYEDGTIQQIATGEDWLCAPGPVLESGLYDGEIYDANQEIPRWSYADCEDSGWQKATPYGKRIGSLCDRYSLEVVEKEQRKPVQVIHTPAGETVLDFGQNLTGWFRIQVQLPKGRKLFLQMGEILQNDCFYNGNLGTAKQEYTYISDGRPAVIRPHFAFYGYRYMKVEGWPGEVDPDAFTACVMYSDLERTGNIETDNPKLNRLFLNALWGQKGNFLDVPTDCPQRDERMGWTGDTQIFCASGCFNMDSAAFYLKFMRDTACEQGKYNGSVPHTVPQMIRTDRFPIVHGSCAWGDAATVVPWTCYLHYGDRSMLEREYRCMRDWVEYIKSQDEADGGRRLWQTGFHFADWLSLDRPGAKDCFGGTDCYYVASAYYYYSALLTAKAAKVLGKAEAADYFSLAAQVKDAFQKEYFTLEGDLKIQTQTAHAVALYMRLVPCGKEERILCRLRQMLDQKGGHLDTGFVGTPYLCPSLSDHGANDYAYTLLLNEDYPSWLYEVNMGATTIWERWNSVLPNGLVSDTGMNSLNHYAYGSIVEWMYCYMCGINPVEEAPGFAKIRFAPKPDPRVNQAKATLESPKGHVESAWSYHPDGSLEFSFEIPFDAEGILELPKGSLLEGTPVTGPVSVPAGRYTAILLP